MPDSDAYPQLVDCWEIVEDWLADIRVWMPEYLSAYERQRGIDDGLTSREILCVARHAGQVRAGEGTPVIIAWPAGAVDHATDPDTGEIHGTLQLGLAFAAGAADADSTATILHRYRAALTGLLDRRTTLAGHATDLVRVDEDYEALFETEREQRLAGAVLSLEAHGVVLGHRHAGPPPDAEPRRDPSPPWPPAPVAETVHVDVQPQPIPDPEDIP